MRSDSLIHRSVSRRGLTIVELSIGVVITSVIMLALATFVTAVSKGWRDSDVVAKDRARSDLSAAQLRDLVSNTRGVLEVISGDTNGGASLLCWGTDSWGGTDDGMAQFGELMLIEYEPATKTLWLYRPKDSAAMTLTQRNAASSETWPDELNGANSYAALFKSSSFLLPRTPLVGGASSDGGALVTSAQFAYFAATNGRPIATYQFGLATTTGATTVVYDNIALRAALLPTNIEFDSGD